MEIIAVANQKGGVGKSTTTINIASILAQNGSKVLVIDLDPQGHCTKGLGVHLEKDEPTVADVLCGSEEVLYVNVVKETSNPNLFILPSNLKLALAEMELASMGAREFKLRTALPMLGKYDYVLIDCPPTFTTLTINAFTTAGSILMPVQMGYFCMEGVDGFVEAVNFVNKKINTVINHKIELKHVLITFFDKRTKLSQEVYSKMEEIFGYKIFENKIPVNIKIGEAQAQGKSITEYDPNCPGAKAYVAVTDEFLRRLPPIRTYSRNGGAGQGITIEEANRCLKK